MPKYKGKLSNGRAVILESDNLVRLVQNDKETTIIDFEFKADNIFQGIDIANLNAQISYINVDANTEEKVTDIYIVDDLTASASPDTGIESIKFSWTIGNNATTYAGSCLFQVILTVTNEDNVILQQWETVINLIPVYKSLENVNVTQPKDFVDLVSQLKKYVSDIKKWFAQVITEMGVQTAPDDSFEEMMQNILKISSGGYGVSGYVDTTIYANGILFSLYGVPKEVE